MLLIACSTLGVGLGLSEVLSEVLSAVDCLVGSSTDCNSLAGCGVIGTGIGVGTACAFFLASKSSCKVAMFVPTD